MGGPGTSSPRHADWAGYLRWVSARVDLMPEIAVVEGLSKFSEHWRVRCRRPNGTIETFEGDGLVITGPGSPAGPSQSLKPPQVMDGATFWTAVESFRGFKGIVAVVGAGETSAAIAVALAQNVDRSAFIHVYTPGGLYIQGVRALSKTVVIHTLETGRA